MIIILSFQSTTIKDKTIQSVRKQSLTFPDSAVSILSPKYF